MKKYPLYIAISLIFSILFFFQSVLPKYRDIKSINKEIAEKEIELRSQENYFQRLHDIFDTVAEKQRSFQKVETAIPQERSLPELLSFFQKATSQSGLILQRISPGLGGGSKKGLRATEVNLVLKGNYSYFKDFLSQIERSARLIEVENIYFVSPGEDLFTFNIKTKVYSY